MKRKIDYVKVRTLYDEGLGVSEIGRRLGTPKGTISKILKKVNCEVTRHVVSAAPKYLEQRDKELDRLEDLFGKVTTVLDRLESEDHGTRLDYVKEARLIVGTIKDIQYKLIKTMVWAELVKKIDEAVSNGCETCQKRIRGVLESVGRG